MIFPFMEKIGQVWDVWKFGPHDQMIRGTLFSSQRGKKLQTLTAQTQTTAWTFEWQDKLANSYVILMKTRSERFQLYKCKRLSVFS